MPGERRQRISTSFETQTLGMLEESSVIGILHKIRKAARSFPDPMFRRALRLGVTPSHEHLAMLSSLGDVRMMVNVGANVGQFALLTLRVLPNAHVHSFEPLPDAANKFQKVIDGNPKVTLHRMALGA